MSEREFMEYDVVVVGAGPAGLAFCIRLKQLKPEVRVCLIEKAAEIGAHILSGAVMDPRALDELLPDWREQSPPLVPVGSDELKFLTAGGAWSLPHPPWMRNTGCWTGSLNGLVRWLAGKAEAAGVNLFAGFPAADLIVEDGAVKGVVTNDKGVDAAGKPKANFEAGVEIRARVTVLCDGSQTAGTLPLSVAQLGVDMFALFVPE